MGVGAGIFLIAVGAILTFAIRQQPDAPVDVDVVGWILMAAGLAGVLLSLLFWESWAGRGYWARRRAVYTEGAPAAPAAPRRYAWGRRRAYVEDVPVEEPPPPPGY